MRFRVQGIGDWWVLGAGGGGGVSAVLISGLRG